MPTSDTRLGHTARKRRRARRVGPLATPVRTDAHPSVHQRARVGDVYESATSATQVRGGQNATVDALTAGDLCQARAPAERRARWACQVATHVRSRTWRKSSTRLVLICGLPASGKSTLARQLAPKIPAIRLDKDGWVTQLGADVWDDEFRVRLEHQLWVLSQDLLAQC